MTVRFGIDPSGERLFARPLLFRFAHRVVLPPIGDLSTRVWLRKLIFVDRQSVRLATGGTMDILFAQSEIILQRIYVAALGFIAVVAFIAVVSPAWFRRVENCLNRTVDTSKFQEIMDRPIDTDRYLRRHTRLVGVAAFSVALLLASFLV